jgi:hypothetical protein
MNKLLVAVLLAVSTQVIAEEKATPAQREELCSTYEKMARQIITIRQDKSMSLKQVLDVTNDKVARNITLTAWEKPSYSTDKMQKKVISEFSDDVYLQCLKVNDL